MQRACAVVVVIVAGCGRYAFDPHASRDASKSDGSMIVDAQPDAVPDAPWMTARTFGKATIGAASGSNTVANARVSPFVLSERGLVTAIHVYLDTSGVGAAAAARALIYASTPSGEPGPLVAASVDLPCPTHAPMWVTFDVSPPVVAPAGTYWVGDSGNDLSLRYYYDGVANAARYGADDFADGPAPVFDPSPSVDNREISVYVDYLAP